MGERGKSMRECCFGDRCEDLLSKNLHFARVLWLVLMITMTLPVVSAAEPLVISPNELTLSYIRPDSVQEPVGDALVKEWADVYAKVLRKVGLPTDQIVSVRPVHQTIFARARSLKGTETDTLRAFVSELKQPSERLSKSDFISKLIQSRSGYGLLTRFTVRFSSSIDVSGAIAKITALDDAALASIGLAGYKLRASGVQLIEYSRLQTEKDGNALPSGDSICASSPAEKIAVLGVGFSSSGSLAPNERQSLEYPANSGCSRTELTEDLALHGAYTHGIIKRICPSCYTIGIDAGCGLKGRGLVPFPNVAEAIVLGALRDASTILVPVATLNARLPINLSSELGLVRDAQVVIVAPTGDFGSKEKHFPAAGADILGVGAIIPGGSAYELSNTGPWVRATAMGVKQRTEFRAGELRSVTGTSAAAATIAARVALLRALEPTRTVAEVLSAAEGGFFGQKVGFVCKERPDAPNSPPSGPGSPSGSQGSTAAGSPASGAGTNGGVGATGGSSMNPGLPNSSGAEAEGSGGAKLPVDSTKPEQAKQVSKRFSDLGKSIAIHAKDILVTRGDGGYLFGQADVRMSFPSGTKQANGTLRVESGDRSQVFVRATPADRNFGSTECFQAQTEVGKGSKVVVLALSDVTIKNASSPFIHLKVFATPNWEFSQSRSNNGTPSSLEYTNQIIRPAQLGQAGDLRYAVFNVQVEPRVEVLCDGRFDFEAAPGVSFTVEAITVVSAQEYREVRTELPALFAGFKTQTGVREGLFVSNQAKQGSLLHGPYMTTREPTYLRLESDLTPQRFSSFGNFATPNSPQGKAILDGLLPQFGGSSVYRDISINANPLYISTSSISNQSQQEVSSSLVPVARNPLWRSRVPIALVPPTTNLEFRHIIPGAPALFKIRSVTAVMERLTHYDQVLEFSSDLSDRLFGGPDIIEPHIHVQRDPVLHGDGAQVTNRRLLGEFDGGGFRIVRNTVRDIVSGVRFVTSIPQAHHDSGKLTPSGWYVSNGAVKKDDRVYDQLLFTKHLEEQPVGALQAVIKVRPEQSSAPSFSLTLLNEVTAKGEALNFDAGTMIADKDGNLWAAITISAVPSKSGSMYRLTVRHKGGSYEIQKVLFLSDRRQVPREVEVPTSLTAGPARAITHQALQSGPDDVAVTGIKLSGSVTFGFRVQQTVSLSPVVNLLKPQDRIVTSSPSHYNALLATVAENDSPADRIAISSAVLEHSNLAPGSNLSDREQLPASCSRVPPCPANRCEGVSTCTVDFTRLAQRGRFEILVGAGNAPPGQSVVTKVTNAALLSTNVPISGADRKITTTITVDPQVRSVNIPSITYTIARAEPVKTRFAQSAFAEIFGSVASSLGVSTSNDSGS